MQPQDGWGETARSRLSPVSFSCLMSHSECTPADARADRGLIAQLCVAQKNKSSLLGCQELAGGGDFNPVPFTALMLQYISNLPRLHPPPNLLGQGQSNPGQGCPSLSCKRPTPFPADIHQHPHLEVGEG